MSIGRWSKILSMWLIDAFWQIGPRFNQVHWQMVQILAKWRICAYWQIGQGSYKVYWQMVLDNPIIQISPIPLIMFLFLPF